MMSNLDPRIYVTYCNLQTIMKASFTKQLDKINLLLNNAKAESINSIDSISLISNNISRPKIRARTMTTSHAGEKTELVLVKEGVPKRYAKILENLFRAKCEYLSIEFNQKNWQTFLKAFFLKNKIVGDRLENKVINFNDFYFGQKCVEHINSLLRENPQLSVIKLNKNYINPINLIRMETFKELSLCNCKLGNDVLEDLFLRLKTSVIQKICLSSPELKDRNQLTRYERLIELIQGSQTLHTLELSNIEIHADSFILQRSRNTSLKHIDLSDNSDVKGICPSIISLNLSRNAIIYPFNPPLVPNQLQYLNLSYNKIPYYHFKQFLKVLYFPSLKHLVLDHIRLDGDISAIQFYLEQSLSLVHLSMVDCDLNQTSFLNISQGIKHSRSLQTVDLTRNRVINSKVAQCLSAMLQSCLLKSIKMRHCDISDELGKIIFSQIHKNKNIQKIDMMNNLMGDLTAKAICDGLKNCKNITSMEIDENIIKYKDMQEIKSYLQGNKYFAIYQLDKEYNKLQNLNHQIQEASLILNQENEKFSKLQRETNFLHLAYVNKFKRENDEKKGKIKKEILQIRAEENQIMIDISLRQSLLSMTDLGSRRDSFIENYSLQSQ